MNLDFRKTVLMMSAVTALGFSYSPEVFAASPSGAPQSVQQSKRITGRVFDSQGPVIGASVMVKGTSQGAVTDLDGNYSLTCQPGTVLVISYIGYKTQEVRVGDQTEIPVTLEADNTNLDEVVVVGYGVQKKKLLTGATVQVDGSEIANRNTISPLTALQNQSPGVNIVATSGKPGAGFNVNIRGAGSNRNNTPLYIIDGVAGDISSINPADIERIDVLKDAASSAIYGARAANGVILVTTKQGKAGKVSVNYDGNIGWQNLYRVPKQLTAKEYMEVMDWTARGDGKPGIEWDKYIPSDVLESYKNGTNPGTNWLDLLNNKNAITTSHSLNVVGGSELSKFSIGAGYQYQDGVIGGELAPSDYRRFTLRINSDHVIYRHNNRNIVTFGENIYYQHSENKGIQIGNMYSNAIYTMLHTPSIIPAYNTDGSLFTGYDATSNGWNLIGLNQYFGNPLNVIQNSQDSMNKSRNHNLNATGYITISPIKGLTYKGVAYYKNYSSVWKGYKSVFYNNTNSQNVNDQLSENMNTGWNWGTTHTLNYVVDLNKHHLDVLAGTEYSREGNGMGEGLGIQVSGNIFENSWNNAYAANFSGRDGSATLPISEGTDDLKNKPQFDHSILSYFGRINYDWNETYMLSLILRADGSSNFADGHRWGWFPSVSAGWVLTNESFLESAKSWMDFLKIRGSWGQNGNENIGSFLWNSTYSFGPYGQYSFNNDKEKGFTGGYPSRMANPDLKWETSEQLDLGFDARFLNQRLGVAFDYYNKITRDLLIDVPIEPHNGFDRQMQNAGTVKNSGIELALNWNDKIGKDFNYNIGWNIASNKNEVTEVNNGSGYIQGGENLLSQATTFMARFEEGHPLSYFYGYKTSGVLQNEKEVEEYVKSLDGKKENTLQGSSIKPGDLRFVDNNNDGVIDDKDKTELGDPHPDVTMGINLGFNWKGLDFSVSGYAALGQQVAHSYRRFGDSQFDNWSTNVYNYWNGENTGNGRYPNLTSGSNVNMLTVSDIYVDDASYFRLQNITLGYDFSKIWKTCPFQQLRVYFQAQNLFNITGYDGMDPEQGSSIANESWVTGVDICNYPQPRTYLVGVNVKF